MVRLSCRIYRQEDKHFHTDEGKSSRDLTHSLGWGSVQESSPSCSQETTGTTSQETTGTTSSRALLQAATALSLAPALPVQRPFLLGPILSYSLASTCPVLSLQFHPVGNSLIPVSWFNSLIWRRRKTKPNQFPSQVSEFKGAAKDVRSTPVNVREPRWEQAGAHPAGSQSQQGSPAACGTAATLGQSTPNTKNKLDTLYPS